MQLVRGDEEPRGRQKSTGGRGGQGGGLSEAGREILGGYMREGLGDHILLMRLFQVRSAVHLVPVKRVASTCVHASGQAQ